MHSTERVFLGLLAAPEGGKGNGDTAKPAARHCHKATAYAIPKLRFVITDFELLMKPQNTYGWDENRAQTQMDLANLQDAWSNVGLLS